MYKPTIGLEIHCELKTKSKMFCDSPNNPDETRPNFNVCPICLGHPGTLPVINEEAVKSVLKLGLVVGSVIPPVSRFDRKSYFYPDLPKGYQISQYKQPLVEGGSLTGKKITRIHLEEDTGTLSHVSDNHALVDFNRAGVPLMELVTEPDIHSAEEAVVFAKELRLILRYLGISDADMERGQMRVEVNISLSKNDEMGTKVEIKNLNSFKAVKEAIDFEIKRQTKILEEGKEVAHETRGWEESEKTTVSQRTKEKAHDYRYFPEPDLPPLDLTKFDFEDLKSLLPELPAAKRVRFAQEYGLSPAQTEILVDNLELADYFEEAISELLEEIKDVYAGQNKLEVYLPGITLLYNYFVTNVLGVMTVQKISSVKELKITPDKLASLVSLVVKKEITTQIAKDILKDMALTGLSPTDIIKEKGLTQISDEGTIEKTIEEIIKENPAALNDYQKGKANALQFLIGQAMKKLKGQANPDILRKLFEKMLSK
jgi:aspartyl-tRNA(Asn)/glutamyl-tRNA(Gln) amidotransferase subunit B